ncbi:MAG: alanine--tRNA ligase, partial [Acidimicrobiales bacterium]
MMEADRLRRRFTEFFVERGHRALPPASLVANDPTILFTIAGMVPFKPYFLGEQAPPAPRVTTIQPCLRTSDIEIVGTTANHCTFFEMLGNFSFGDYFKAEAIPWAWEFVTEVLELDPDRLFVTVHVSDDEAAEIWRSATSLGDGRLQRLDEDNFWQMGDTGPCGPDSEIFFDRGAEFGPEGGPAAPGADESDRYIEVWNLVFTQYDRATDGALSPLPKRNIDTGAGLDRLLVLLQGAPHVQAIDSVFPVLETAAMLTKRSYGSDPRTDTSLRIVADHARAFTFCVADGVFPSNEGRGYVLRRLVRRAVLRTQQLGRRELVTPDLVASVVATMGTAYPNLERDAARIEKVILHEEEAFLRTLAQGTALLDEELGKGAGAISGDVAFRLHDTFGFPFELTKEVANERGVRVDEAGYEKSMDEQRRRAREAARQLAATPEEVTGERRRIRLENGPTIFAGYCDTETDSRIVAVLASAVGDGFVNLDGEGAPAGASLVEVFLDITPFYAEGGGQVGDTGELTTATGKVRVIDTTATPEGLTSHLGHLVDGHVEAGEVARAAIDVERRDAIRRNHTGTHLLHSALRTVLGDHVRQQGSLVAPDRLRFDFSHFSPLSAEEIAEIEDRVNSKVIADEPVATFEASKQEAE